MNYNIIVDNVQIKNGFIYYGKNIIEIPKGLCLDLGCGNFEYENEYNTPVIGIDKFANLNKINFIKGDLNLDKTWDKVEDNSIDFITSIGVLHWTKNINYIINKCNQKLKKSSTMFHFFWSEKNFDKQILKLLCPDLYKSLEKEYNNFDNMLKTNVYDVKNILNNNNFKIIELKTFKSFIFINEKTISQCIANYFKPRAEFIILHAEKVKCF